MDEVETELEGLEPYCTLVIDDLTVEPPVVVGVIREDDNLVDKLPLFRTGLPDNELADVLVGVVRLNLDVVVAFVDVVLTILEVDVGRNTPLLGVKEVEVVRFARQDSGMVKQHGRVFTGVLVGSKTPE